MYNSGNSSKNVTGASVVDGTLENADYADNAISGDKIDGGTISGSVTLVTPDIGTPSAGTLTNCSGTASSLTSGNVTTNANLTGVVTSSGNATAIADNAISGDKIDAGVISNFQSTGIDDNATSTAITIDASENVGIGVVPESAWGSIFDVLQIGSGSSISGENTGTSTWHGSNTYHDGTNWKYINHSFASLFGQTADGKHQFKVAPSGTADAAITWTTAMTIANSGVSTFGNAFAFSGQNSVQISAITEGRINIGNNSTGTRYCLSFYNANGNIGKISTNGSSTSYATSSDYRLKENVVPMTGSIDRLKNLKPSKFNFIADPSKIVDGFLAHEAGAVVPESVTGAKDAMMDEEYEVTPAVMDGDTVVTEAVMGTRTVPDYQGIDQAKIVPLLVSALQEAITRIETLENA